MLLKTVSFVNVSDLFLYHSSLGKLFMDQDSSPFSWSMNNSYSLISKAAFLDNIGELVAKNDYPTEMHKQFIAFVDCVVGTGYINLED